KGEERWRDKYQGNYDHAGVQNYLTELFPSELKRFEDRRIVPLDAAYLAWLKSAVFKRYFKENFDTRHPDSGVAYTQAAYIVLKDATGRQSVCDYLETCFRADPLDTDQVELRALLLNQEALLRPWVEAAGQSLNLADQPLDWLGASNRLYSGFKAILDASTGGALSGPFAAVANYTLNMTGPITRMLGNATDAVTAWGAGKLPEKRLMSLLTTVYRLEHPRMRLLPVQIDLTRQQATRVLSSAMASMTGQPESRFRSQARRWVDAEQAHGQKSYRYRGVLVMDEAAALRLNNQLNVRGLSPGARDRAIAAALREEDFEGLLRRASPRIANVEVKTGFIGVIFAGLMLKSGWDGMMKDGGAGANQKTLEFGSAIAAFVGAGFETSAAALKVTQWGAMPLAKPIHRRFIRLATRADVIGFAGRVIGAAGGIMGGILSIYDGTKEMPISPGYGRAMIGLGVLSLFSVFLMFTSFAPLGFILAIVIAIVMVVVGFFKPDDISKWLARTMHFGNSSGNGRFPNFEAQSKAFAALSNLQR
ncbi:MAG: hypothetical protein LBV45_06390, partial [Xanthomonadaceae bacterium]|nr:hypothetical protein [Xanthomonadaceae bacterium]